MIARYVQRGDSIDYIPDAPVAAGDLVIIEDLVAVAKLDIPAGILGSLAVSGVYEMPKGNTAIALGKKVYWDAVNEVVTATASTNILIGKTVIDAGATDQTVRVLLNG